MDGFLFVDEYRLIARDWFRTSIRLSSPEAIMAVTIVGGSTVILWLFDSLGEPRLILRPHYSALAVGAALLTNAIAEEVIWRGVIVHELQRAGFTTVMTILVQGSSFGLAHWGGYPFGTVGVALATLFGIMVGVLRLRMQSLVPAIGVHLAVDFAIYKILF